MMFRSSRGGAAMGIAVMVSALSATSGYAQAPAEPAGTRAGAIVEQQAAKAQRLTPYQPGKLEAWVQKIDEHLSATEVKWHPFYGTAYQGAGPTLGAGYVFHTGDYDSLDVRASMSINQSKRAEAEYRWPRVLARRGVFRVLGGWREGIDQNFFGIGTAETSAQDRTAFDFRQAYGSARLDVRPARGMLLFGGGVEYLRFEQRREAGSSFEQRYTSATLPGVGATVNYVHTRATAAIDSRPATGYAKRGGYYGVTAHRYDDAGSPFSFRRVDYDVVQHLPVLRDAWVLSLRGRVQTTYASADQAVPFFMLPWLGNARTLRGFSSMRFRDRNSLLLSAEWRVLVSLFADAALFYDAGKVTGRRADLNLAGLKSNYGIGFRLHTPATTPLRIDFARGNEGFVVVLGSSAVF